jgi:hypothetical protein
MRFVYPVRFGQLLVFVLVSGASYAKCKLFTGSAPECTSVFEILLGNIVTRQKRNYSGANAHSFAHALSH